MTAKKLFLFWLLVLCQIVCAQKDSIVALKEVVVSDVQLQQYSNSLALQRLNDSIIGRNSSSLTSLLQFNSVLYFKQNGLGMVSSPSFRGTTAQQTAVVWNGININSQFNGQTDFNTITTRDFDNITIRAGGGSALYGSSAIGGSIHLNNELIFKKQFANALTVLYGSYNTVDLNYKTVLSSEKNALNISISRNSSDNDYEYPGMNGKKNENGQFNNASVNVSFGYRLNSKNILKFFSQYFSSERHFSGTIASVSHSKYEDVNTRSLADWIYETGKLRSSLKLAYLTESYKYFEHYWLDQYDSSRAGTFIAKYNVSYRFSRKWEAEAAVDYNQTKGNGSNIGSNIREISGYSIMTRYTFSKHFQMESSLRKESTVAYQSPVLYAVGLFAPITKHYQIKLNHSKNFRIPTFNDLYWNVGGNANLRPEESVQTELGQELRFHRFRFVVTAYHNAIRNLIQWKPDNGIWRPENVWNVEGYGAEFLLESSKKIGNHQLSLTSTYAYTVSRNEDLKTQLTYVPFHKYNANFTYGFRNVAFSYQYLFNGAVYTLNDNKTKLKEYVVSNIGISYCFGKKNQSSFGVQSLNCWNESYQSVPGRPLPGRNFQVNLILKL